MGSEAVFPLLLRRLIKSAPIEVTSAQEKLAFDTQALNQIAHNIDVNFADNDTSVDVQPMLTPSQTDQVISYIKTHMSFDIPAFLSVNAASRDLSIHALKLIKAVLILRQQQQPLIKPDIPPQTAQEAPYFTLTRSLESLNAAIRSKISTRPLTPSAVGEVDSTGTGALTRTSLYD